MGMTIRQQVIRHARRAGKGKGSLGDAWADAWNVVTGIELGHWRVYWQTWHEARCQSDPVYDHANRASMVLVGEPYTGD